MSAPGLALSLASLDGLLWLYHQSFDVVVTPGGLAGAAAVRSMDHHQPGGCGPVWCGWDGLVWFVPGGTAERWPASGAAGRVDTAFAQRLLPLSPGRARWVRPPAGHLVDPTALASTVEIAWLGHPACERVSGALRVGGVPCPDDAAGLATGALGRPVVGGLRG